MKSFLVMATSLLACGTLCAPVVAEPTAIDVRVISKGGKFVGTSMGGAEVVIRDAETGEILARGKTAGSTGDTAKIMTEQVSHHAPVSTKDAAVFHAELDMAEPRRIQVTARGPLAQPQAANTVSATQWVVPGKPVTGGDAFVLEMPGFVVDVLSPPAHLKFSETPESVSLRANVCMMCGCPVTPDGLWDANRFEVAGIVYREGSKVDEVPLEYAGQTSQFHAALQIKRPGAYEVVVFAHDPANGNTGVDKTTFIVTE
ncbi:MAG: hypothetical protein R6U98_02140 [Pirellulaceae bacterium]